MNIPQSIIRPFEPHGMPFLTLGIKGGVSMSIEELCDIKQAINDFMDSFKHLDLTKAAGPSLVEHGLPTMATQNGADWARCKIRNDLSGNPRAFVEYGKFRGRSQLYSVPVPRGPKHHDNP